MHISRTFSSRTFIPSKVRIFGSPYPLCIHTSRERSSLCLRTFETCKQQQINNTTKLAKIYKKGTDIPCNIHFIPSKFALFIVTTAICNNKQQKSETRLNKGKMHTNCWIWAGWKLPNIPPMWGSDIFGCKRKSFLWEFKGTPDATPRRKHGLLGND